MEKLSVIIPTQNRDRFLQRCLEPFRGFAMDPRLEVIVVDDASRPEVSRRNEDHCRSLSCCRYIYRRKPQGASNARNLGTSESKGTFLWFMDDDDYASPETVTDVLRAISQPDWAARVILLPMTIVSRGIVLNHVVPREDSLRFERLRRFGHEVSTSCVIFPRGVIESVDGWDERLVAGQDTDLFLRVSRHADAKCLKTHAVSIEWQTPKRITRSIYRQQFGKIQFLCRHWQELSLFRTLRYLASIVFFACCFAGLRISWAEWKAKRRLCNTFAHDRSGSPFSVGNTEPAPERFQGLSTSENSNETRRQEISFLSLRSQNEEAPLNSRSQIVNFQLKIKKVLRYCRLYGLSRTYIKVQGRRHMARKCEPPNRSSGQLKASQVIGVIGCGNYSFANIAYYLTQAHGRIIGGCMDVDSHRAASLAQYYRVPLHTTDAAELIDHPQIRMLFVASNHASHAEYAIQALERGKDVYIEKPHVVNEDQLNRLVRAMELSSGRVYLGFNRPSSRFGRLIRQYLDQEVGPAVYSWFVAGHALAPDHWYHHPQEGGRVLGNLCHWTDFLYCLAGPHAFPIEIRPTCFDQPDVNIVVSLTFGDGSLGAITFSEKEEPFEGIKEKLCAHKGNCLITMEDFQRMTIEVRDRKRVYRNFFRDHGHRDNILGAFDNAMQQWPYDREQHIARIANTAVLFLKTKEALERKQPLVVYPYQETKVNCDAA